jgi:hypothetical protein
MVGRSPVRLGLLLSQVFERKSIDWHNSVDDWAIDGAHFLVSRRVGGLCNMFVGCALTRDWAVLSQAIGKQSIDWINTAIVSVIVFLVRRKQPRPITTSTERANHSRLQISNDTNCLVSPRNDRFARVMLILTLFAGLFSETVNLHMSNAHVFNANNNNDVNHIANNTTNNTSTNTDNTNTTTIN